MIKRLSTVLLCLLMIFTFTACQKDQEKVKDTEIAASMDMEDTAQVKLLEKAKGTTIHKMGDIESLDDYDFQLSLEFMDKYGIEIEWMPLSWNEYLTQLPQLVASGNPPDTARLTDARYLNLIYGGLVSPLNEYLVLEDEYWDKDVLDVFCLDGNYYGVNTGEIDTYFIYYNKTLFEEEGIDDPYELYEKGEWTFDKLREIAKKATLYADDGVTVETYGISSYQKVAFALTQGEDMVRYNDASATFEPNIKSPAVIAGLNFYKDLIADGSMYPAYHGYTEFPMRKLAMFFEMPENAIYNNDLLNKMKDEIGIVPFPASIIDGKYYAPSNIIAHSVPANCQNPEGGMLWNYYWIRRMKLGEATKNETWQNRRYKMMTEEHEKVIIDYLEKAKKVSTKIFSLTEMSNYEGQFWGGLSSGKKTAEEVADSMENLLTTAIDRITNR